MARIGNTTPHGCEVMPRRFPLIIKPQSAAGGCRPNPKKLSPAISAIENVSRSPNSTSSGVTTLGSTSPKMMRRLGIPISSAAFTNSRSITSTRGTANHPSCLRSVPQRHGDDEQPEVGPEAGNQ